MTVRKLEWDSEFFGVTVGMTDSPHVSIEGFNVVHMLVDASDHMKVQEAEAHGYRYRDIKVTLARATGEEVAFVRTATEDDSDVLAALARTAHHNTRFYADHNLPRERCDDLYDLWVRRSITRELAQTVLVVEEDKQPVGYVTVPVKDGIGSIGLIAVNPNTRKQGHGNNLVRGAVNWCHHQNISRIEVVTQGNNIKAQRLFQQCGFRTVNTSVWLSKWQ